MHAAGVHRFIRCYHANKIKNIKICGLQLPRKPHQSTRFLQLTGRWQYCQINSTEVYYSLKIIFHNVLTKVTPHSWAPVSFELRNCISQQTNNQHLKPSMRLDKQNEIIHLFQNSHFSSQDIIFKYP